MSIEPVLLLSGALLALLAGALARRTVLLIRGRGRRRVVEAPNSHHDPRGVRNIATLERWSGIRLDRVHEINRGEVERLLSKADALGSDALLPRERQFLDVILENSRAPEA